MKITLVYTYKRKYSDIENMLMELPKKFKVISFQITPSRAFAFEIAVVPALLVLDENGEVKVKREGLALVKDYIKSFVEKK